MPYLIMDKRCKKYKVFRIAKDITLGRDEKNDIRLDDPDDKAISRFHASIDMTKDTYILKDTSANGTVVNNEKIKKYKLRHGDHFQIIDYSFTFIDDDAAESFSHSTANFRPHPDHPAPAVDPGKTMVMTVDGDPSGKHAALKKWLRKNGIVVVNDDMLSLYADIQEIAGINVPVMIFGEPGTGKEKVAQTLHALSTVDGDFVPLNCSAIPEGIFESELFGSVKGAFHNATDKPGKIELANNGTLFLDELGDMNISLQPKLLRFLEDKKLTRLGDTRTKTMNVRVVTATNQDLKQMIKEKSFRDDLFQRLACITLNIPPLRERKEDILPLSAFFLSKFAREHRIPVKRISKEAKKMLLAYSWPGNVRELGNVLLGAAVRSRSDALHPAHLSAASEQLQDKMVRATGENFLSLNDMEKIHIKEALEKAGGNKVQAAKLLGISRDTLYKKLRRYKPA